MREMTVGRERESWAVREMTERELGCERKDSRERESWAVREMTAERERAGL